MASTSSPATRVAVRKAATSAKHRDHNEREREDLTSGLSDGQALHRPEYLDAHSDARANRPIGRSTMRAPVAERELRTCGCSPCTVTAMGHIRRRSPLCRAEPGCLPNGPQRRWRISMRPIRGGSATAVTFLSTARRSEVEGSGPDTAGTVPPGRTALSGSPGRAHSNSAPSAAFFPTHSAPFLRASRGQFRFTARQYPAESPYRAGGEVLRGSDRKTEGSLSAVEPRPE